MKPFWFLIPLTVLAAVWSLCLGAGDASPLTVLSALLGQANPQWVLIVQEIRLPRLLLGLAIGAALGLSGAALQGLLRNPLADPGVIGTSSAAGLGAVVALYFGWSAFFPAAVPFAAMVCAGLAMMVLLAIVGRYGDTLTLILAGVAVSSLAVALTSLAMSLSENPFALSEMVLWLLGSLKDRSFDDLRLALPFMALGAAMLLTAGRGLDALALGEETAASLGFGLLRLRLTVVIGTALAVGAAVAVSGSIGFVGLVVPHLLRPLVLHRPSALLLPSALAGGLLVTGADITVRLISPDRELMLGVVTSLLGAPFFLFLISRLRRVS
jgi:iron complex transport system permease protein